MSVDMPENYHEAQNENEEAMAESIGDAQALIEMYQAGFVDAYTPRPKSEKDFTELNKKAKKCFMKRFEKKIEKEMQKNENSKSKKNKVI